jgi:5-methylcytosine-specific restriction endonuclease McrA
VHFRNTLYTNDNLFVLNGLNSNLVDLIYLDPPFNSKRMYSAPVGSRAAGSSFKDMWTWQDVDEAYLDITIVPKRTDIKIELPSTSVKECLYKKQDGLCNACKTKFDIRNLEIDHIIPKAKGGGDYYENYQLLCGSCNRIKGDRPMEYLRLKIKTREEMMENKIIFGE